MSENPIPNRRGAWSATGLVLPALLGLCLLMSPLGRPLVLWSYDLLFLLRPSPAPASYSDAVILDLDEASRAELHQNPNSPWDRRVHARLLNELASRGAKLVVFDVLFDRPSPEPEADLEFAAAMRAHGPVVLAASEQTVRDTVRPASSRLLRPTESLGTNGLWGLVEWPVDAGSSLIIRRQFYHRDYPSLAWRAAEAFGKTPADRQTARWLNYYGPGGTVAAVSYHRALQTNSLPPGFFDGKAVFIGKAGIITTAGQDLDRYATPFSHWREAQTSGVELQATAFLNLINGDWFEEASPVIEIVIVLAVGTLLGFGLPRFKPWTAAAVALIALLLTATSATACAWGSHRWFPWLIVCVVQIPCALAWSLVAHTRRLARENAALERDLALAESALPELRRQTATEPGAAKPTLADVSVKLPPIPNHQLLRCIGRGSYGEVWLARDEIGSYHAVKVVYRRSFSSATPYDREFRGIQKFTPISRSHPGFVHILHVGRNDPEGYFFYIMELGDDAACGQKIDAVTYMPGSLAQRLEAGRLPLPDCIRLGLDLAAALEYLHGQQLVHRDIKPSNIIFVNGAPKFADVGLVTDLASRGKDPSLVGTEGYLSPEGPGTAAADIYSLGKVLYEAFTGCDRREFPCLPSTLVESSNEVFAGMNEVILKACDLSAPNRYRAAADMLTDLRQLQKMAAV